MQIFKNLRVIELASVLAAPAVGQFFAECGAKVLKIENPNTNGDVTRSWRLPTENAQNSVSAYFSAVNWGKESLSLDITTQGDRQQLYEYIKSADIVLASYKKGDAQKLGVDYATLQKINPQLIYGHITGYGNDSARVGYDALIQAETGFVFMNGDPTANPDGVKMPVALIDVLASHQLKEGLLVALLHRERTGEGSCVSVSLYESALASLVNQATNWLNAGHSPQRMGSEHPNIFPYGTIFSTQTGKLMLVVGTDKQFSTLCQLLGIEDVAADERFQTNAQRVKYRELLRPILATAFAQIKSEELLPILTQHHIPAGSVNDIPTVFAQSEAQKVLFRDTQTGLRGVKSFIAQFNNQAHFLAITPPPPFEP